MQTATPTAQPHLPPGQTHPARGQTRHPARPTIKPCPLPYHQFHHEGTLSTQDIVMSTHPAITCKSHDTGTLAGHMTRVPTQELAYESKHHQGGITSLTAQIPVHDCHYLPGVHPIQDPQSGPHSRDIGPHLPQDDITYLVYTPSRIPSLALTAGT